MFDGPECLDRPVTYALRGRIRGNEFRVFFLERLQFPDQPVVLGVRHRRFVEYVITVIVEFQLFAELLDAVADEPLDSLRDVGLKGSPAKMREAAAGEADDKA